ncbi:MAG TPA: nucleotide exchange factor GrpE [Thermoplasmata archaeon]|jgi:molecular chaperone GrpE|nr:MAG TPA: nucleotide exchange factor GrpE [Thermoplasmata archaeon]
MSTKKISDPKKQTHETSQNKIKKLEDDIRQLKVELNEKNDKYLRTLADFQNYQKRIEKELIAQKEDIKKKYLLELLDQIELLKKAYDDPDPKPGLKLLLENMDKFLKKEGITYIECKGKPFDYQLHNAVSTVEQSECVDGTVIDEIKKGYFMGEKLLRPSHVIVAKKKP